MRPRPVARVSTGHWRRKEGKTDALPRSVKISFRCRVFFSIQKYSRKFKLHLYINQTLSRDGFFSGEIKLSFVRLICRVKFLRKVRLQIIPIIKFLATGCQLLTMRFYGHGLITITTHRYKAASIICYVTRRESMVA